MRKSLRILNMEKFSKNKEYEEIYGVNEYEEIVNEYEEINFTFLII